MATGPVKLPVLEGSGSSRVRPETKRAAKSIGKLLLGALAASGVGVGTAWAAFGQLSTVATEAARAKAAEQVRIESRRYTDQQFINFEKVVEAKVEGIKEQISKQDMQLEKIDARSQRILWELQRKDR